MRVCIFFGLYGKHTVRVCNTGGEDLCYTREWAMHQLYMQKGWIVLEQRG